MNLGTLISSNAVINNPDIKSKKRALELLAEALAEQLADTATDTSQKSVNALDIFQLLTEREKLGSTGMGHGVALPHARSSLTDHAIGAFIKLNEGIDFDSPDNTKNRSNLRTNGSRALHRRTSQDPRSASLTVQR